MKNLDEGTSAADMHASEAVLKRLGLASPDFQYRALMVRVLTEQVAGYYEPKTRQFHLADWIDVDGQKPIMAHELTHALQDQHFNLQRFENWPKGDSDAELAAHALIEGDATLAMVFYLRNNPLRGLSFLKSMGAGVATEELDKAPRALRETLLFPYQEGLNWTTKLYRQGGWNQVSQAFNSLPRSTEQIMHPDKYFANEAPVNVTLPDLTGVLNTRAPTTKNSTLKGAANQTGTSWKRIASDINGEWGFYLILDQFLKAPAESRAAAAGWGGDRFELYEGSKGEELYVSLSSWDTENDAHEFFDAYVKRIQVRYPNVEAIEPPAKSQSSARIFRTPDGIVTIELHGLRVLVTEGIPSEALLSTVLKTVGV